MTRAAFARFSVALAAACVAALLAAPSALAACERTQWQIRWVPDLFGSTGGSLIRVPVCIPAAGSQPSPQPSPSKPGARKKAKSRMPTRAQYRALRFRPSEAVSATVRRRMVDHLAYGEQADAIRAQIESDDLMRQFRAQVRRYGGSPRDLGDMYSQAYLDLWQVVNGRVRTSAAVDRAVRSDLRRQLALDRSVRNASDSTQQDTAEWLGSWTTVLAGSWLTLRSRGDTAGADAFRVEVRRRLRSSDMLGVDLADVRLTRRGIRQR